LAASSVAPLCAQSLASPEALLSFVESSYFGFVAINGSFTTSYHLLRWELLF